MIDNDTFYYTPGIIQSLRPLHPTKQSSWSKDPTQVISLNLHYKLFIAVNGLRKLKWCKAERFMTGSFSDANVKLVVLNAINLSVIAANSTSPYL